MGSLLIMLLAISTMIFATITVLHQYYQTAKAFPCVGHSAKEYCTGYHNGAIQANLRLMIDFNYT